MYMLGNKDKMGSQVNHLKACSPEKVIRGEYGILTVHHITTGAPQGTSQPNESNDNKTSLWVDPLDR